MEQLSSARHGLDKRPTLSSEFVRMWIAGAVALVILVAAVIALPRSSPEQVRAAGDVTAATDGEGTGATTSAGVSPADLAKRSQSGAAQGNTPGGSQGGSRAATTYGGGGSIKPAPFVAAKAPGITKSTIYIGIGYSSQAAAGNRAIGAAGAAQSYDARDVFNTSINYANKNGGFAGRKLKALYYDYSLTTDASTNDQSACAYYTQDNKIFALGGGSEIRNACAEKAGGIAIGAGAATITTYRKYPHLISPNTIRFDRLGQVTVTGLYKAKYFGGKLGFVTWDDPLYRLAESQGYTPSFKKYGIKVAEKAYIMVPQQFGALGDMTAAVSSAVAKFKSLGIDHVIIQDGPAGVWAGAGLTFEWMNQAKSQRYYPRYGQNSYNAPGWDVLPADQMDRAVAISATDIDKSYDEGWKINQFREKCFKIHADAGYPVKSSNRNDPGIAAGSCDLVFFLQRVINGLPLISADNFIAAAQRLGRTMPSASVYGINLFPGRRDGGAMVRTQDYYESCRCLKFRGPPYDTDK
jgi:hypothetical protein